MHFTGSLNGLCSSILIITAISKVRIVGIDLHGTDHSIYFVFFNNPHDWKLVVVGCIFTAMAIWRHRANIGRLMNGTENKLGQKVKR